MKILMGWVEKRGEGREEDVKRGFGDGVMIMD